jgi:hypothetical protein
MSIILWPFRLIWNIVTSILALTGRLVAVVLGLVLLAVGAVLTVTIVGAVVGIPLMALGVVLLVRGIF